jgi:pantetheine-phosphate adenylyltransferase
MKLVFPGSFDPITAGHMELIERASGLAEQLYVVVEDNLQKTYLFTREQRLEMVRMAVAGYSNVYVDSFVGMTIDYCRKVGARVLLRGLRNSADYLYEKDIATFNRELAQVETMFLFADNAYAHISSSAVRELLKYNADITGYVPDKICDIIYKIKSNR